jgi:exopolysaccharide production protein ExoQ
MNSAVALGVWSLLLVLLLRYKPQADSTPSVALWLPVVWLFLLGSRLPSQWLGLTPSSIETAFAEGSPLDRGLFVFLSALAAWILITRRLHWRGILSRNYALAVFILFALVSITWSDVPFISFKRWVRDLGTYLMVLIVVSDASPLRAMTTVIRRVLCLLLVLSIVLIKYYPGMGVLYNPWSGTPEYVGVATSKNMLGVICLIGGIYSFWDTVGRWRDRRSPVQSVTMVVVVNAVLMVMTLYLLRLSSSATSSVCLVIGCLVIALLQSKWARSHPRAVTATVPAFILMYGVLELVFGLTSSLAGLLGRDPTLTGRTGIWRTLLAVDVNPLLGTGYQSFWTGDRLVTVWRSLGVGFFNEAHNGYLETYLNLGLIGLAIMCVVLMSSYGGIIRTLPTSPQHASFGLAVWSVVIVYNVTESALGPSFIWFVFLLSAVGIPLTPLKTGTPYVPVLTQHRRVAPHSRFNVPAASASDAAARSKVGVIRHRGPQEARRR